MTLKKVSICPPLWDIRLKDYGNRDVKSKLQVDMAKVVMKNGKEDKNKEGECILLLIVMYLKIKN